MHWYNEGRDSACPPNSAPALSDNEVLPVLGLSHLGGGHSGGGESPVSVLACDCAYLQNHFFLSPGKTVFLDLSGQDTVSCRCILQI